MSNKLFDNKYKLAYVKYGLLSASIFLF